MASATTKVMDFIKHPLGRKVSKGQITFYENSGNVLGKGSERGSTVIAGKFASLDGRNMVVAVKRVGKKHFIGDLNLLVTSQLEHDNVIAYFATETGDKNTLIAMEFCIGTLEDWVRKKYDGPSFKSVNDMLRQITLGLEYLHSRNVIHCNLKPQNVLISLPVSQLDNSPVLKLSDFCYIMPSNNKPGLTYQVDMPWWPVPELSSSRAKQSITRAVDVFLLGCLFFYVLSGGENPFRESKRLPMKKFGKRYSRRSGSRLLCGMKTMTFIETMIASQPEDRPSLHDVLQYPFIKPASDQSLQQPSSSDSFLSAYHSDTVTYSTQSSGHHQSSRDNPSPLKPQAGETLHCSKKVSGADALAYFARVRSYIDVNEMKKQQDQSTHAYQEPFCRSTHSFPGNLDLDSFTDAVLSSNRKNAGSQSHTKPSKRAQWSKSYANLPQKKLETAVAQVSKSTEYLSMPSDKELSELISKNFPLVFRGLCIGLDDLDICQEARKQLFKRTKPTITKIGHRSRLERFLFVRVQGDVERFKDFAFKYGVKTAANLVNIAQGMSSNWTMLAFKILPTASFELDNNRLEFTEEASRFLEGIENANQAINFLHSFGSHFVNSTQQIGGLICYSIKIILSKEETYDKVKRFADQVLDKWISSRKDTPDNEVDFQGHQTKAVCSYAIEIRDYFKSHKEFVKAINNTDSNWRLIERNVSDSSICSVWDCMLQRHPQHKQQAYLLRNAWLDEASVCRRVPLIELELRKVLRKSLNSLASMTQIENAVIKTFQRTKFMKDITFKEIGSKIDSGKNKPKMDNAFCSNLESALQALQFKDKTTLFVSLSSRKPLHNEDAELLARLLPGHELQEDCQGRSNDGNASRRSDFFCHFLPGFASNAKLTSISQVYDHLLEERTEISKEGEGKRDELSSCILRLAVWNAFRKATPKMHSGKDWALTKTLTKKQYRDDLKHAKSLGMIVDNREKVKSLSYPLSVRLVQRFMHDTFNDYVFSKFISSIGTAQNLLSPADAECVYKLIVYFVFTDDEYEDVRRHLNQMLVPLIPAAKSEGCPFASGNRQEVIEKYPILGNAVFNDLLTDAAKCQLDYVHLPSPAEETFEYCEDTDMDTEDTIDGSDNISKVAVECISVGRTSTALESYLDSEINSTIYRWIIYCLKENVIRTFRKANKEDWTFIYSALLLRSLRRATQYVDWIGQHTVEMIEVLLHFFDLPQGTDADNAWFGETFLKTVSTFIGESTGADVSFDEVMGAVCSVISSSSHLSSQFEQHAQPIFSHLFSSSYPTNSITLRYLTYGQKPEDDALEMGENLTLSTGNCCIRFKSLLELVSLLPDDSKFQEIMRQVDWFIKRVTVKLYREQKISKVMLTTMVFYLWTTLDDCKTRAFDDLKRQVVLHAMRLDVRILRWLKNVTFDQPSGAKKNIYEQLVGDLPEIYRAAFERHWKMLCSSDDVNPIYQWTKDGCLSFPPAIYLAISSRDILTFDFETKAKLSSYFSEEKKFDTWFASAMRYSLCHIKDAYFADRVKSFAGTVSGKGEREKWLISSLDRRRSKAFFDYVNDVPNEISYDDPDKVRSSISIQSLLNSPSESSC